MRPIVRRACGFLFTTVLSMAPTELWCDGPTVEIEERVTNYTAANNGAGPLWCYGAPLIARHGDDVFVCALETGADVRPLCNTRWQLWRRTGNRWRLERAAAEFREREPCPIGVHPDGTVLLSANPSTAPPGTRYGPCKPTVLRFAAGRYSEPPAIESPLWQGATNFTDHSYRGFAFDSQRRETLLLNIDARTSAQHVSWRDAAGRWHARGRIQFPIRAAYPQVALRRRAAHVLAISDIREPVAEWRKLKREETGRDWDYVFRRLFYARTQDIAAEAFGPILEVASVEKTAGHITNLDLHIDRKGGAHLLWLERPHQHAFLRDRYFPGEPITTQLVYAQVVDGKIERRTLAETPAQGAGLDPTWARFHVGTRERLALVVAGVAVKTDGKRAFGNFWTRLDGASTGRPRLAKVPLVRPFTRFFLAGPNGGSAPSERIDIFGSVQGRSGELHYARVRPGL